MEGRRQPDSVPAGEGEADVYFKRNEVLVRFERNESDARDTLGAAQQFYGPTSGSTGWETS